MTKKPIHFEHYATDDPLPPFDLMFVEPEPGDPAYVIKCGGSHSGWADARVEAIGTGRYLSYREYQVSEPSIMFSKVSESVIALHIQVNGDAYFGYKDDTSPTLHPEDRCNLFWQGDRITETQLLPGSHVHLDIFIRPEELQLLAAHPVIAQLLQTVSSSPAGDIDFHPFTANADLQMVMEVLMNELNDRPPSLERFNILCDALLLTCLGQTADESHFANPADSKLKIPPQFEDIAPLLPLETIETLDEIIDWDRKELRKEYWHQRRQLLKTEEKCKEAFSAFEAVKSVCDELIERSHGKLADVLFEVAIFLAEEHDSGWFSTRQKTRIKRAITRCCEHAFKYKSGSADEIEFYRSWSGREFITTPKPLPSLEKIQEIIAPNTPSLPTQDGTIIRSMLVAEKTKSTFGPLSPFVAIPNLGISQKRDKPIALTILYNKLMEEFSESLVLGVDTGGIQRSDIACILDIAYDSNDLLGLLRVEIAYLGGDVSYIHSQDDNRLRLFIATIQLDREMYQLQRQLRRNSYSGRLANKYIKLGSDKDSFKKYFEELWSRNPPPEQNLKKLLAAAAKDSNPESTIKLAKAILLNRE